MGSGLILLLIVLAWLAVLVPMALRSHEVRSMASVDKFQDAMRVLSRRGSSADASPGEAGAVVAPAGPATSRRLPSAVRATMRGRSSGPASPAKRLRRVLIVLVLLAIGTAVGFTFGPLWMIAPHVVVDLLLLCLLFSMRMAKVRRAERQWRASMGARPTAVTRRTVRRPPAPSAEQRVEREQVRAAARAERARAAFAAEQEATSRRIVAPAHVAGIPDRMPARESPRDVFEVVAEAVGPQPPRGAKGEPWQPVPVPVPTYVNAPTASRRSAAYAASKGGAARDREALEAAERELGIEDTGPSLEDILRGKRASGDW